MFSSIKFDLDENNSPVIIATTVQKSDDVRDKIAVRFFENNSHGEILNVKCINHDFKVSKVFEIRPAPAPTKVHDNYLKKDEALELLSVLRSANFHWSNEQLTAFEKLINHFEL